MNKRKTDMLARKIEKIVNYLGNAIPRGRECYDDEPNCNIQWDSLREYKDDTMIISEHSVGTHIFENNKPGFVVFEAIQITSKEKEVFSAQYDRMTHGKTVYKGKIKYVPGKWENKLASLYKKAKQAKRLQDKDKKIN